MITSAMVYTRTTIETGVAPISIIVLETGDRPYNWYQNMQVNIRSAASRLRGRMFPSLTNTLGLK